MAMIVADHVAPMTIDFGYFVGVNEPPPNFAENNVANFVIGALLESKKASVCKDGFHGLAKNLGFRAPLRGEFLLHSFVF